MTVNPFSSEVFDKKGCPMIIFHRTTLSKFLFFIYGSDRALISTGVVIPAP